MRAVSRPHERTWLQATNHVGGVGPVSTASRLVSRGSSVLTGRLHSCAYGERRPDANVTSACPHAVTIVSFGCAEAATDWPTIWPALPWANVRLSAQQTDRGNDHVRDQRSGGEAAARREHTRRHRQRHDQLHEVVVPVVAAQQDGCHPERGHDDERGPERVTPPMEHRVPRQPEQQKSQPAEDDHRDEPVEPSDGVLTPARCLDLVGVNAKRDTSRRRRRSATSRAAASTPTPARRLPMHQRKHSTSVSMKRSRSRRHHDSANATAPNTATSARFCLINSDAMANAPAAAAAVPARRRPGERTARITHATPATVNGAASSSPLTSYPPNRGLRQRPAAVTAAQPDARRPPIMAATRAEPMTTRATATQPIRRSAVSPPSDEASRKIVISNGGRSTQ